MEKIKRAFIISLFILGVLGLIDTIGLVFYTNINVGTLLPGFIGLLLVAYSALKLGPYKTEPLIKKGIIRNMLIGCIVIFSVSFILIEALILYNSRSDEAMQTDYLLILGAGINGDTVSLTLKTRLDKGAEYLNEYPAAKVIVSGGQGPGEDITEAEAMKTYLIRKGIDPQRIIPEDRSTSTMENFMYSKRLINGQTRLTIITSDFHMLRAKMLAQRNGFEPLGITCKTPISVWVNCYVREYFALIKSLLIDRY
jgi:uncharacterized SAM-binding protein YcdF (DUF218 family)